jgi:hypothetical protein
MTTEWLADHAHRVFRELLASLKPDADRNEAASALTRAQNYANQRGARYAAISNGYQWLLSMTFVPNQPTEDSLVHVLGSLGAIHSRKFREFFLCFSPMAIRTNLPSEMLVDSRRAPAPAKLSTTINGYPVATLLPGLNMPTTN